MPFWKATLFVALSIATCYYLEVGFKVCWIYNQAKQLSLKFQKQAYRLADMISCNKPEERKQDIDKFLALLQGVLQEV